MTNKPRNQLNQASKAIASKAQDETAFKLVQAWVSERAKPEWWRDDHGHDLLLTNLVASRLGQACGQDGDSSDYDEYGNIKGWAKEVAK